MPRPSHLSSDNILRFLQVRRDPASTDEIAAGLHMRRADRHTLHKMLNTLKKRRAIQEIPGGRYQLAGRDDGSRSRRPERQETASEPTPQGAQPNRPALSPRDEIK